MSNVGLAGFHIFRHYHPVTSHDEWLLSELGKWSEDGKGHIWAPKCAKLLVDVIKSKNLTVTSGRAFIAQILCNTATESNKYVTHFAIGTDNTAATEGDTTLGSEQFRKAVSSALDSSAVANISTFLGASEANFAWKEWGHFINGTSTADSGTLLSHHIESQTKSAPNTVTIDSTYTISDA